MGRVEEAIQCYNVCYFSYDFYVSVDICSGIDIFCFLVKRCLALQPSHPQALTNLGNIYMEWYAILMLNILLVDLL